MKIFLTGGTGFLGSHVAEAALAAGHEVRALVRPGSHVGHLESVGATVLLGKLDDAAFLRSAMYGCDVVVHAAARVGDWGSWQQYLHDTVDSTRQVCDAAAAAGARRLVHISTVGVYRKTDASTEINAKEEDGPLPPDQMPRWYYYGRAKSLAESLAMQYHADQRLEVCVLRPGWIYGPRDRASLPRLLQMLSRRRVRMIGDGSNVLCLTYVTNVADAVLLAATRKEAAGQVFNVSNDELITQRQYLAALSTMLGTAPPKSVPFKLAFHGASLFEMLHKLLHLSFPPQFTRQGVVLVGKSGQFSTDRIRHLLGWSPRVDFATAIDNIGRWWKDQLGKGVSAVAGRQT